MFALLVLLAPASTALSRAKATTAHPPARRHQPVRSTSVPVGSSAEARVVRLPNGTSTPAAFTPAGPSVTSAPDRSVFELALAAAFEARRSAAIRRPSLLTIIDYSRPSTEPRLWVIDLDARRILFEELVAHGRNSGDNLTRSFSNDLNSRQSSIGLFLTGDTYVGSNGYSLRLEGLEPGFNDHALARAIVVHGAPYVSSAVAKTMGRLGRSWGCPAVRPEVARELIDTIKGGSLVFSYYPDARWLQTSRFLAPAGAVQTAAVASADRATDVEAPNGL